MSKKLFNQLTRIAQIIADNDIYDIAITTLDPEKKEQGSMFTHRINVKYKTNKNTPFAGTARVFVTKGFKRK